MATHTATGASAALAGSLAPLLGKIPLFGAGPRQVSELPGGLTNRNYKVTTQNGCYVVRVSPREADLLSIDRDNEYHNSVAAAAVGVGAPVLRLPARGQLMVWSSSMATPSPTRSCARGQPRRASRRPAAACTAAPRFVNDFDMFEIQRGYLDLVRERGFRLPDRYLEFAPQVAAIRAGPRGARRGHRAVQQRPARRELHRRRHAGSG